MHVNKKHRGEYIEKAVHSLKEVSLYEALVYLAVIIFITGIVPPFALITVPFTIGATTLYAVAGIERALGKIKEHRHKQKEIQQIQAGRRKTRDIRNDKMASKFSIFFAAALRKPEDREFFIGDLEERFKKDVKNHGCRWAQCMLWRDNLVDLWSAVGAKTIKGLKWLGFGYLIEKFLFK